MRRRTRHHKADDNNATDGNNQQSTANNGGRAEARVRGRAEARVRGLVRARGQADGCAACCSQIGAKTDGEWGASLEMLQTSPFPPQHQPHDGRTIFNGFLYSTCEPPAIAVAPAIYGPRAPGLAPCLAV
jgi:hypothetical protein